MPKMSESANLWFEQAALNGSAFGYTAYGVHLTLFLMTFPMVWRERMTRPSYAWATMVYIFLLFAMGTTLNFSDVHYVEEQFVDNPDYPGGPVAYEFHQNAGKLLPVYLVNTWFADAMMVFRFAVIFQCNWWLVAIPTTLFLVSIGVTIAVMVLIDHPNQTYVTLSKWSTSGFALSVGTTVVLTIAIVVRLLMVRRRIARETDKDIPECLSASAMLIESAFIYSIVALPHAVLNSMHNPGQLLTFRVVGQVQSIGPLLIIFRVAQRRAWTRETAADVEAAMKPGGHWDIPRLNTHHSHPSLSPPNSPIPLRFMHTDTDDDKFSTMKFAMRPLSTISRGMTIVEVRSRTTSSDDEVMSRNVALVNASPPRSLEEAR